MFTGTNIILMSYPTDQVGGLIKAFKELKTLDNRLITENECKNEYISPQSYAIIKGQ